MSRFDTIDGKLIALAQRLNATLTKGRPEYPEVLRTFEERRIDWTEGEVRKAIVIQPRFELTGVNSTFWNFNIVAWHQRRPFDKRQWNKDFLTGVDFGLIEKNIDELLQNSEDNLNRIAVDDLK